MAYFEDILTLFRKIYGSDLSERQCADLIQMLESFENTETRTGTVGLTEQDSILITYGDALQRENSAPLQVLKGFLVANVGEVISTIHLLPFFPYSSDDGFSVIDFNQVDPSVGTWEDVVDFAEHYDLMFDAVINHISVKSVWFQGFLRGEQPYSDYFITVDDTANLSEVFRPRALPLLTSFPTASGPLKVWTTFSEDQIDLNYHSPDVLLDIIRILLMFVQRGARFIRLDAIAYIWKEVGTNCLHMENAHRIVQLFRLIFDAVAPHVQIITETNVPHEENISYFGNGYNEAQLVYNFSLPPLVLHAFYQKNTFTLTRWAKNLKVPSKRTSFFNFLASHDGIGVTPAKGLISESEIKALCERVKKLGGFVSYKDNPDGSRSPYELNINYLDALGDPNIEEEPNELIANRFLASQSIMIALKGVPGIYYHSLLGSRSWPEGTEETGCYRSINREKLDIEVIRKELRKEDSLRKQVFEGYLSMLRSRAFMSGDAFSPLGEQFIIDVDDRLFCVFREDTNQRSGVLCLTNVTPESVIGKIYKQVLPLKNAARWQTVLTRNANFDTFQEGLKLQIGAYGVLWLITRSS